jgi:acyl carrier protein
VLQELSFEELPEERHREFIEFEQEELDEVLRLEPYYHDEVGLLALLGSLEETFDIDFDDYDLTEQACGTVQQLAALIRQKQPSRPDTALLEQVRRSSGDGRLTRSWDPFTEHRPPRQHLPWLWGSYCERRPERTPLNQIGQLFLFERLSADEQQESYFALEFASREFPNNGAPYFVRRIPRRLLEVQQLAVLRNYACEPRQSAGESHIALSLEESDEQALLVSRPYRFGASLRRLHQALLRRKELLSWPLAVAIFARAASALQSLQQGGSAEFCFSAASVRLTIAEHTPIAFCPWPVLDGPRSTPHGEDPLVKLASICASLSDGPDNVCLRALIDNPSTTVVDEVANELSKTSCAIDALTAALMRDGSDRSREIVEELPRIPAKHLLRQTAPAEIEALWKLVAKISPDVEMARRLNLWGSWDPV